MTTAGRNRVWTAQQVAARLAALNGVAPEPVQYVGYRDRTHADGRQEIGYELPGEPHLLSPAAFEFWLARRGLAGAERLAVAVLVIREILDDGGLIESCVLERRRGLADGPLHGEPARVEFAGPASTVRLFQVSLDGTLSEMPLATDTPPLREPLAGGFEGDLAALRARFGEDVPILDMREPNVLEEAAGLAAIGHVRRADGRGVGCGVIWHGTAPFVLEAAFPPLPLPLPSAQGEADLAALLRTAGLAGHETRRDMGGLAMMARRPGSDRLFRIALTPGPPRAEAYTPRPDPADALPAQRQWLRYAAKYEYLTILDSWTEPGQDEALDVLSGDAAGQVWRHHVDAGGVELWRMAIDDSAIGAVLHDRRLGTRLSPAVPEPTAREAPPPAASAPPPAPPAPALPTPSAATPAPPPPTAPGPAAPAKAAPPPPASPLFGVALVEAFPEAAHDMEQAMACLASGHGTAAVFHAERIATTALRSVARAADTPDPLADGNRRFKTLAARVAALAPAAEPAFTALRHAWHGSSLRAQAKYTEAESAEILARLAVLLEILAPQADTEGDAGW